jgi:hypothetical protein
VQFYWSLNASTHPHLITFGNVMTFGLIVTTHYFHLLGHQYHKFYHSQLLFFDISNINNKLFQYCFDATIKIITSHASRWPWSSCFATRIFNVISIHDNKNTYFNKWMNKIFFWFPKTKEVQTFYAYIYVQNP